MKRPIKVNEKDIKEIEISDDSAAVRYFKHNKDDSQYEMRYYYAESEIKPGEQYCKYCGEFFPKQAKGTPCPFCYNRDRRYCDKYEVRDMVYSMLQEECVVIITLWDGTKKEFSL